MVRHLGDGALEVAGEVLANWLRRRLLHLLRRRRRRRWLPLRLLPCLLLLRLLLSLLLLRMRHLPLLLRRPLPRLLLLRVRGLPLLARRRRRRRRAHGGGVGGQPRDALLVLAARVVGLCLQRTHKSVVLWEKTLPLPAMPAHAWPQLARRVVAESDNAQQCHAWLAQARHGCNIPER